mmetsp:Transcript_43181/g.104429  ORF Transcript_43181/g.104429 Transcript_43181/m.104429 type:complete len:206 (+) Transcript_43181:530-1147(+)
MGRLSTTTQSRTMLHSHLAAMVQFRRLTNAENYTAAIPTPLKPSPLITEADNIPRIVLVSTRIIPTWLVKDIQDSWIQAWKGLVEWVLLAPPVLFLVQPMLRYHLQPRLLCLTQLRLPLRHQQKRPFRLLPKHQYLPLLKHQCPDQPKRQWHLHQPNLLPNLLLRPRPKRRVVHRQRPIQLLHQWPRRQPRQPRQHLMLLHRTIQ